jgi:hypothetical protein
MCWLDWCKKYHGYIIAFDDKETTNHFMNKTNNIIYYVIKAYVQSVMRQLHINYRKSTKKKKNIDLYFI